MRNECDHKWWYISRSPNELPDYKSCAKCGKGQPLPKVESDDASIVADYGMVR